MLEVLGENHIRAARAFGLPRAQDHLPLRAARRHPADGDADRHRLRQPALGRGLRRDRLRPAGRRQADLRHGRSRATIPVVQGAVLVTTAVYVFTPCRRPSRRLARPPCPRQPLTMRWRRRRRRGRGASAARALRRPLASPLGAPGLVLVAAVLRSRRSSRRWLTPYEPERSSCRTPLEPPSAAHLARHRPARPRHLLPRPLRRPHRARSPSVAVRPRSSSGSCSGMLAGYGPRWLDNAAGAALRHHPLVPHRHVRARHRRARRPEPRDHRRRDHRHRRRARATAASPAPRRWRSRTPSSSWPSARSAPGRRASCSSTSCRT